MFVISNFLIAVAQVIEALLTLLYWLIIIRALLSWVNPDPFNPIVQFLHTVTEPILGPIRRMMPFTLRFGFDISAVVAIFAIIFLKSFLIGILFELSARLR